MTNSWNRNRWFKHNQLVICTFVLSAIFFIKTISWNLILNHFLFDEQITHLMFSDFMKNLFLFAICNEIEAITWITETLKFFIYSFRILKWIKWTEKHYSFLSSGKSWTKNAFLKSETWFAAIQWEKMENFV